MDGKRMNEKMDRWMDGWTSCFSLLAHLDGEVGLGVEKLGAEGQQQLLVGVDDVRRLDKSLHAHRLRQDRQDRQNKQTNKQTNKTNETNKFHDNTHTPNS